MTKKRARKKTARKEAAEHPDAPAEDTCADAEGETASAAEAAPKAGAEEDIDALQDRYLRLRADFENFKTRTRREKDELYRRANQDLILEMLPVLDHLDLALEAADAHGADPAFVEGFKLVGDQMLGVLKRFNLVPIETAGCTFDPNLHEAVTHEPSELPEDRIIGELRKGYMLGDDLLRPSQVRVSSGPIEGGEEDGNGSEES